MLHRAWGRKRFSRASLLGPHMVAMSRAFGTAVPEFFLLLQVSCQNWAKVGLVGEMASRKSYTGRSPSTSAIESFSPSLNAFSHVWSQASQAAITEHLLTRSSREAPRAH